MPTQGAQTILYVEPGAAPHTYDANSHMEIIDSETLRRTDEMVDAHGIRGTRSHAANRVVRDRYNVGGTISLRPGELALNRWMPRVFGGTTAGGVTALAETIATAEQFGVLVRRGGGDFSYTDCKVNQAILRGSSGNPLSLELEIFGKTEALVSPGALPTFTYTSVNTPVIFSSGTLTLAGASRTFEEFTLTINNNLVRQFYNSATAQHLSEQDRNVSLSTTLEWTTALRTALYNLGPGGTASGGLDFALPTGGTLSFGFGTLIAPAETPTIPGKVNLPFTLNWTAHATDASNLEVQMSYMS